MTTMASKKSVIVAYLLWMIGGIFGAHHFYLRRDRHAFVWWTTLGGFLIGWLGEIFRIPRYVRDTNEDPKHMEEVAARMRKTNKPPFSMNRFTGMLMVGYSWAQMTMYAIPPEIWGINPKYLNLLVPLATGLGVWTVGNIGREQGCLKWAVIGSYIAYPIRYYVFDDSIWITLMVIASACVFDSYAKEWRRTPRKKRHIAKRMAILSVCCMLYIGLWCSYLYFHGTITDSEGDEIPIYEAIHHFFTSPWWLDVKQCIAETYQYAQHHGWYEVWKQVVDMSDPHGEQNAYKMLEAPPAIVHSSSSFFAEALEMTETPVATRRDQLMLPTSPSSYFADALDMIETPVTTSRNQLVLGVSRDASQQEITSVWRKLSRENHPDKVKDELARRAAQERFMEIQQAYEILSNSKHRRNRRNKKDNSGPAAVKIDL